MLANPEIEAVFDDVTVLDGSGRPVSGTDRPSGVVGDVVVPVSGRAVVQVHAGEQSEGIVAGSERCPLR